MMLQNLSTPPNQKYKEYLQADFIELLCLVSIDHTISRSEVLDLFIEDADINLLNNFNELDDHIAENSDEQTKQVENWFSILKRREQIFDSTYPFELNSRLNTITRHEQLNEKHKLYIYLLMASCLRHFPKNYQTKIANSFEIISVEAIKQHFGKIADFHIFGANSLSSSRYSGNKYNKIKQLSEDLFEDLLIGESTFPTTDTGDEGLDIVGWISMEDKTSGMVIVFGQCACTEDWDTKQNSSKYDKWSRLINLSVRPINIIFIPFCFRDVNGTWAGKHRINLSLMVDRVRLLNMLKEVDDPLSFLPIETKSIIDFVINYVDEM